MVWRRSSIALETPGTAMAGLDYQRISLAFAGATSGSMSATDSFLSARLGLGFTY